MSNFNLKESIEILERTPDVLETLISGLSEKWILCNEGDQTWSTYDIVGHLIHGDVTDWLPRIRIILSPQEDKSFKPFDRFAQFNNNKGKKISPLLKEFKKIRRENIGILKSLSLGKADFRKMGIHPEFGNVSLAELISAWVVHDLNHLGQISRVLAKHYKSEVGPWIQYLKILNI